MYYRDDSEQLTMEEFFQPFGGRLRKDNRWVCLAGIMPWEYIEEIYVKNLSGETGRPVISFRIAFGAIFIKEFCHLTDEGDGTGAPGKQLYAVFSGLARVPGGAVVRFVYDGAFPQAVSSGGGSKNQRISLASAPLACTLASAAILHTASLCE